MLRQEAALARLQVQVNRITGGQAQLADFLPWANDEEEATPENAMKILMGARSGK